MAIIKKRCIRCRKELRGDGTCQNPDCVRYTPGSKGKTAEGESITDEK